MTVASFFRKYSVGCILNYVSLIIIREIPVYIYSYSCSSALRSVRSQHNVKSIQKSKNHRRRIFLDNYYWQRCLV
jgi:hypothetical protein